MKKVFITAILGVWFFSLLSCKRTGPEPDRGPHFPDPVDSGSVHSVEAVKLMDNLKSLANAGNVLIGHQGTTIAGASGWRLWEYPDGSKSDFKDVCGKFPALYGWEFSYRPDSDIETYDYISYDATIAQARAAHGRGGVNSFIFHPFRLDNKANSWNTTPGYVAKIIPGGALHDSYKEMLDVWVLNFKKLKDDSGTPIPFVIRVFPEMDGNWFWWGTAACSDEEYKTLFRFTINYLREKGLNNMLVCYAPGIFTTESAYLKRYPGDDVVDILGFDAYYKSDAAGSINGDPDWNNFVKKLEVVSNLALSKNKIAAVAETGQQNITSPDYFTQLNDRLSESGAKIAYMMFWANYTTTVGAGGSNGFYVPYMSAGAAVKDDFNAFIGQPHLMAEGEHPDLFE